MFNSSLSADSTSHDQHGHQEIFVVSTGLHEQEILLLPICVAGVIENILVCLMICYYRNLRNTTNIFIFGLCVTNCLFAGVLLPMHCFQRANEIYLYMTIIIILIYICNLTAVTVERFIAIIRPLHYVNIITKRRAVRIVVACYILPVVYCLIPIAWQAKQKSIMHKIYIIVTLVVFMILPLLFTLVVYGRVYQETHKFYKKHHMLFAKPSSNNNNTATKITLLQEVMFMCCLFNKKMKDYSLRYSNNGDKMPESIITSSEDTSSPKPLQRSSLYEKVLQIASAVDAEDSGDESVSLTNNYNVEATTTLFEDAIDNDHFKRPRGRSMSFDAAKPPIKRPHAHNRSSTRSNSLHQSLYQSHHHTPSALEKANYDSVRANYVRRYRRAKCKLTELKSSLAFAMVSLTYMFTWLPVVYMTFLEVIGRVGDIPPWLSTMSVYTIGLNAMIDPLLYGFLLRGFRNAIKRTFRKRLSNRKY